MKALVRSLGQGEHFGSVKNGAPKAMLIDESALVGSASVDPRYLLLNYRTMRFPQAGEDISELTRWMGKNWPTPQRRWRIRSMDAVLRRCIQAYLAYPLKEHTH